MPNTRLRGVLEVACAELGYDFAKLNPYATTHCFRHMLVTFFVNELGDAQQAATLLHHVDTTMVLRTYSAKDRQVDAGDALSRSRAMLQDRVVDLTRRRVRSPYVRRVPSPRSPILICATFSISGGAQRRPLV